MYSTGMASAGPSAEEPPVKEPRKLIAPSLPDDVLLSCLARVSRCDHPNLSLVSKSFRSLLSSPELYVTRSDLGFAERFLYVCFSVPPDLGSRWFTLRSTPNRVLDGATSVKTTGNRLVPVSSLDSPPMFGSSVVSVGSEIYIIGGSIDGVSSSSVWVLDCRSHKWFQASDTQVAREYAAAGVVDGKIYVIAGCEADKKKWVEVFDPKTQTWDSMSGQLLKIGGKKATGLAVLEGNKVYFMDEKNNWLYDPKQGRLEAVAPEGLFLHWRWDCRSWCVIENVFYCCDSMGKIRGYDMKERVWRQVKGIEALQRSLWLCAAMVNYAGKLVVFWNGHWDSGGRGKSKIWCAEIALARRSQGEIWGSVEWFDVVLTMNNHSELLHSLAVTI